MQSPELPQKEALSIEGKLHNTILGNLARLDSYTMKKGRARDQIIAEFKLDPLYSVFGLDSPEYISAILGGTVTSIHRKLGDLYEQCVQLLISLYFGIALNQIRYSAQIASGSTIETRTIDAYVSFEYLDNSIKKKMLEISSREIAQITSKPKIEVIGMGFEVRHCYQSADSKRIQADEAMARHLLLSGIIPIMLVFCNQSNRQIISRYTGTWLVKEGLNAYQFLAEVTEFKFYEFLVSNKTQYAEIVRQALQRIVQ